MILFILLCLSIAGVRSSLSPPPFDVRIDHHKVDTTHDLIINTPRPRFSWKIPVFNPLVQRNIQQIAYQIQLIDEENSFPWDSQQIFSSKSIHVPCTHDVDFLPSTYYRLRIRVWTTNSNEASAWTRWIQFRTPIFNLHEYLTNNADLLWIGSTKLNMNELRKEFLVPNTSPIKSAIVYMTGIGYYEFYLNGYKVDPSRKLDPGWTTYEKRTLLASYDVTANITTGANAIGVKLGNGWYSQEQQRGTNYGPPRLLFTLNITFDNGNRMQVVSDQTWTGREGSIKHDSVYNGEIRDSRNDRPDWARPGFNDSITTWITPESLPSPIDNSMGGRLVLQDMPPIRAGADALHFEVMLDDQQHSYLTSEDVGEMKGASLTNGTVLKPVSMWSSESEVHIFDLGQNMAGWCQLRFKGPAGFGTYIRYGEALVKPTVTDERGTGNVYTENLRNAVVSDTYVLRGDRTGEIYEPTFTVHGFRYITIYGPPNSLLLADVQCPVVHSETTLKGNFQTSNPVINQIQHNILWGQISNIMSLPTDCPSRNERWGWLGDATLTVDEALYNFDLTKFYLNFVDGIVDLQRPNGQVPEYAPGNRYPPDPNWGTALPTIVWQVYRHTNDSTLLEPYYNNIRAYVESVHNEYSTTGLANLYWRHGDWVPPPPNNRTNESLTSSFAFLHDIDILINISKILGKPSDTTFFSALYEQLAEEFHRVFFNPATNFYADGLQAAQVLALALPNVVPSNLRSTVVDYLVTDIHRKGNHVTTGIVSTAQLYPVLSNNGHHDLALELISSITYPSYGYMFNNPYENATTLWELWDTPFEGPEMNSRNHHMFGSVGAWFYSHLAGIDLSSNMITIRPKMASEAKKHLMKKLDCQLSILSGLIHISYTRDERDTVANSILLRVTIPPNAQARVVFEPLFPNARCTTLIEGDQVIWTSNTTMTDDQEFNIAKDPINGLMSVHVGSGRYEFRAVWN